jgi:hypothetical protein
VGGGVFVVCVEVVELPLYPLPDGSDVYQLIDNGQTGTILDATRPRLTPRIMRKQGTESCRAW